MPLYEYQCSQCGQREERCHQAAQRDQPHRCPTGHREDCSDANAEQGADGARCGTLHHGTEVWPSDEGHGEWEPVGPRPVECRTEQGRGDDTATQLEAEPHTL